MSGQNLEKDLKLVISIALTAGKMISDTCGSVKSVETKQSFADLVTETDKNVEAYVFEQLRKHFPNDKFIGEEGTSSGESGKTSLTDARTWIVDPVDGEYGSLILANDRPKSVTIIMLLGLRVELDAILTPDGVVGVC